MESNEKDMVLDIKDLIKEVFVEHRTAKSLFALSLSILVFVWLFQEINTGGNMVFSGMNLKQGILYLALSLFLISLVILISRIVFEICKIFYYRHKYPLNSLSKSYYLISFGGTVFLYDVCKKEKRWIASWQTATDLGYIGHWLKKGRDHLYVPEIIIYDQVKLNNNDYSFGEKIWTRGIPGK
jgi:hypothetical protein